MELTIRQRLVLLQLLPREGTLLTIKLMRELRDALAFTEQEIESFEVVQTDTQITWDKQPHPTEVPVGKTMIGLVKEQLEKLDKAKQMTEDTVELAELFGYGGADANP